MAEEIITETNRETATDHAYGGAQIQVLEGLEAVRKRPGMYIGSTGPSGLHHLVYEIVDNAIDEALAGYCTHIEVTIKPGNIIEVSDNGRGIPVDIQPKLGIPAVTVVYTVLHAGGKFGGEDSGYKVAGGLHGVGASVVNALSEWLTVRVRRDGAEYEQSFKRGKPDGDLKKIGAAASTGTTVTFKPDPEMFQETTLYRYETLLKRLREEAFLNAGVKITLTDERPDADRPQDEQSGEMRTETMCYEGGIRSFVSYLCERRDLTPLHPQVMYMKGEGQGAVAEVALQYYDNSYNELLLSFANNVHTPEGGTHEEGFKLALTRVLNEYGRAKGILKDKDENLSGPDAREGIIAVVSVKLQEAQFEGQTKAKLGNTFIKGLVNNVVYKALTEFFEENPAVAKAILEKATQAARARAAAKKARELVRRKSALESNRMPGKLALATGGAPRRSSPALSPRSPSSARCRCCSAARPFRRCSPRAPPSAFSCSRCCIRRVWPPSPPSAASWIPGSRRSASWFCSARSRGSWRLPRMRSRGWCDAADRLSPAGHRGRVRCDRVARLAPRHEKGRLLRQRLHR